jgi:lipoyl(octanoyl) transferase
VTPAQVAPLIERHLRELLAWSTYTPTPDYAPKPEPGRRITLVAPRRVSG